MFSARLLRYDRIGDRIEPCTIDGRYADLVRALRARYEAFAGKPYRELEADLANAPETLRYDPRVVRGLREVIEESVALEARPGPAAPEVRRVAFALAARADPLDARAVLEEAAKALSVTAAEVRDLLYGDLPSERRIALRGRLPGVPEIIGRYNLRLLQTSLASSRSLSVRSEGRVGILYRAAKARGLLVELRGVGAPGAKPRLEIAGPLALEARARAYAAALARFLPDCALESGVEVEASVVAGGRSGQLRIEASALASLLGASRPAAPGRSSTPLEEDRVARRLLEDFSALRSPWEVARSKEPVGSGSSGFLPDLTFRPAADPSVRADLEILGFWNAEWTSRRLAAAKEAGPRPVIFCADERLSCDREPVPFPGISFRRRVPAEEVLRALEAIASRASDP